MTNGLNGYQSFKSALTALKEAANSLPKSIPFAKKNDAVPAVFQRIPVPPNILLHFETFNRRMDILYGEDTRDKSTNRLPNIKRGPFGIDLVIKYCNECLEAGNLEWDLAQIKIERLIKEIKDIQDEEKEKEQKRIAEEEDKDEDYIPPPSPKRRRTEPDSPILTPVMDSDGIEILEDTELGERVKNKKKAAHQKAALGTQSSVQPVTQKSATATQKPAKKVPALVVVDSGDESDGLSALRNVNELENSKGARRGPPNQSLTEFHNPVPTMSRAGVLQWEFGCRYCPSKLHVKRTVKGLDITLESEKTLPKLNNLSAHTKTCKGKLKKLDDDSENESKMTSDALNLKKSAELMAGYLRQGELNPEIIATQKGFYRMFSAWILDESLPWTTGEAPSLAMLFKYLKVNFTLPTDTTVRNYLAIIYSELHAKIVREFASVKSKIAYSTDTWTTRQMVYTFACTIASFIDDDWNLIERVVDFKPLAEREHEGLYGGLAFVEGARQRGGLDKMSHSLVTTDNASVNDVIVQTAARCLLARYNIPTTADMHIRCIAHVINLVVQAFLFGLDEAEDPDTFDWYEVNKDAPLHYSPDADEEQIALENETDSFDELNPIDLGPDKTTEEKQIAKEAAADRAQVEDDEVAEISRKSALKRLRFITTKIVSSPQRRMQFRKVATRLYASNPLTERSAHLMVVRDIRTRWNYTHAMIRRALIMHEAIDDWTYESSVFRGAGLSKGDWKFLGQIADVLEPFTHATARMSISSKPTIPFVLPIYENMFVHLQSIGTDRVNVPLKIRHGAQAALLKLVKYRTMAQENQYYKIGTMLHPYLRSQWFRSCSGSASEKEDAVTKAESLFKHVAESYFENGALDSHAASAVDQSSQEPGQPTSASTSRSNNALNDTWLENLIKFDVPAVPEVRVSNPRELFEDEVRRYLTFEGGRGEPNGNPLDWWKVHETSFPIISRVARDFLAIPATSTSVERTFSKSRHICADLRSSLKEETITKALLSKVWIRDGLLDIAPPVQRLGKRKFGI